MTNSRFVLDTNILISALLVEKSVPAAALHKAETDGTILCSHATISELSRVLMRPGFSPYITPQNVEGFLARIHRTWEVVTITHRIRVCRDPNDDMFLELAINGLADTLITGDNDLLSLSSYRQLNIITPSVFITP